MTLTLYHMFLPRRVQWAVSVHESEDGSKVYWKDESQPENNWVWQPQGVVNM
jgi:hypothetical protein